MGVPVAANGSGEQPAAASGRQPGMVTRLRGLLRLIRPLDTAMAFLVSLIGAHLAGLGPDSAVVVLAIAGSNAMLCAASMMLNDWHDLAEDLINCPERAIPSGRVARQHALLLCWPLFVVAVSVAVWVQAVLGLLAVVVVGLSVLYTLKLKGVPLAGNLAVAFVSTYPIGCWAPLIADSQPTFLVLAPTCFVFRIGTELLKTAEDHTGDARCGIRTLATSYDAVTANRLGATVICCSLLLAWGALPLGQTRWIYPLLLTVSSGLGAWLWLRVLVDCSTAGRSNVTVGWAIMVPMLIAFVLGVKP